MNKFNMKRCLFLVSMLVCVFSFTACSTTISTDAAKQSAKEITISENSQAMKTWVREMIQYLNDHTDEQIKSDAENAITLDKINGKSYVINPTGMNAKTIEFYNSWTKTRADLGALKGKASDIRDEDITITENSSSSELCTITVKVPYEQRDCSYEITVGSDLKLAGGAINPDFSMGIKVGKALMNTVIGMGTVFLVLIFISFVISLLQNVNKIGSRKQGGKQEDTQPVPETAVLPEPVAEQTDDAELIAVIAAAVAAAEGTSPDGLVVRSIRKVGKRRA